MIHPFVAGIPLCPALPRVASESLSCSWKNVTLIGIPLYVLFCQDDKLFILQGTNLEALLKM